MVLEEEFTVGELTAFIAYTALLTLPLMGLGWVTTMFQQGMVGLASVQSVLQQPEPFAGRQSLPEVQQKNLFPRRAHSAQSPIFASLRIDPGFYRTSTST